MLTRGLEKLISTQTFCPHSALPAARQASRPASRWLPSRDGEDDFPIWWPVGLGSEDPEIPFQTVKPPDPERQEAESTIPGWEAGGREDLQRGTSRKGM